MKKLTPMMSQYFSLKEENKDCLLFFRLGDFYELFFEDAILAAKELEIALTGRECGDKERAPMCGVPYHSANSYINKLVNKGFKVAICEQVEKPGDSKGIVKREVVRIVTPGTIIDTNILNEKENNYICSIYEKDFNIGISYLDITTGDFFTTNKINLNKIEESIDFIRDEINKINPKEIIIKTSYDEILNSLKSYKNNLLINQADDFDFLFNNAKSTILKHFNINSLISFDLEDKPHSIVATGGLLNHLSKTQKESLTHINRIKFYRANKNMHIDFIARKNLELIETLREKRKKGSLLWVIDKTKTPMGGRLIKKWLEEPLIDINEINKRYDMVSYFYDNLQIKLDLENCLNQIYDIERIVGKVSLNSINPRDLIALKNSIKIIPKIKDIFLNTSINNDNELFSIINSLDSLDDIYALIDKTIKEDASIQITDGNIIKEDYNQDIRELKDLYQNGAEKILEIEEKEKSLTGIKTLKIKYNKVFGYFIDIRKTSIDKVPDRYIRKQTLANNERYIIPELKDIENKILNAEDKLKSLEYEIFQSIKEDIKKEMLRLQKTAKLIAKLDVISSLATVAVENDYIRPELNNSLDLIIEDGRHPVIEKIMNESSFIPNNTYMKQENIINLITGPNMAGKSTYMRQVALIVLLAQIGSFIPASHAKIGIVDRIFTRVGASDDLSEGQSTFMVEMVEMANILNNATKKSLLILDEIGRGTSTYDGLSIAWAIINKISNDIKARTFFSTHYHELTKLEEKIKNIKNYKMAIDEENDDIIFLRKVVEGTSDRSYGVEVAKLAGLTKDIIEDANNILISLESDNKKQTLVNTNYNKEHIINNKKKNISEKSQDYNIFEYNNLKLIKEIKNKDLINLTPLEAMNFLYEVQEKIKKIRLDD